MKKKLIRWMLDLLFLLGLCSLVTGSAILTPVLGWMVGGLSLILVSILAKMGGAGT